MVGYMKVLGLLTWSLNERSDFQQDNVEEFFKCFKLINYVWLAKYDLKLRIMMYRYLSSKWICKIRLHCYVFIIFTKVHRVQLIWLTNWLISLCHQRGVKTSYCNTLLAMFLWSHLNYPLKDILQCINNDETFEFIVIDFWRR